MIQYIKRNELEVDKYNACIENSIQSRIYAFSWYLDIVADHWDVLVLDDYKAVMPIPWKRKYGIKYVTQPLWVLELGIFSIQKNKNINYFLEVIFKKFRFVELRLNTTLSLVNSKNLQNRQLQFLNVEKDYNSILKKYNRNRKREIAKALKNNLIENWNDNPKQLIHLFKENVGNKLNNIKLKDYNNLLVLMDLLLTNKYGELLTIYDSSKNLVAAAFFIKYKDEVTQLVCASDILNRKNGAHTFFNDRAIFKYAPHFKIYNFGGSSIKNIANYYKSFGAETKEYQQVKYNNLPFFLKLFKH